MNQVPTNHTGLSISFFPQHRPKHTYDELLESLTGRTLDEAHALLAAGKGEVAGLQAELDRLKRMIGVPVAGG